MRDKMFSTPRPIVASLHRKGEIVQVRRYAYHETAIPTATRDMLLHGKVGDLMVIHHDGTGMWIGEIKLSANGKLTTKWAWDKDLPARPETHTALPREEAPAPLGILH